MNVYVQCMGHSRLIAAFDQSMLKETEMALREEECAEVFAEVEEAMRERGLEWIVAEVREAIKTGKIQEIKVDRRKKSPAIHPGGFSFHSPTAPTSDKTGTQEWTAVDYSDRERLKLLLQALAEYIRDLRDLILHLPDLKIPSEDQSINVQLVSLATDEGEMTLEIRPNMQMPGQDFLQQLDDIIGRI